MLLDDYSKEKELEDQVEKALDEKREFASRHLFFCPHCGYEDVQVDFISDKEDYLCECPNCDDTWTYSKEKFEYETRQQNRVLAKAKRWWRWHGSNGFERFKIIVRIILEVVATTLVGLCFILSFMIAGGVL